MYIITNSDIVKALVKERNEKLFELLSRLGFTQEESVQIDDLIKDKNEESRPPALVIYANLVEYCISNGDSSESSFILSLEKLSTILEETSSLFVLCEDEVLHQIGKIDEKELYNRLALSRMLGSVSTLEKSVHNIFSQTRSLTVVNSENKIESICTLYKKKQCIKNENQNAFNDQYLTKAIVTRHLTELQEEALELELQSSATINELTKQLEDNEQSVKESKGKVKWLRNKVNNTNAENTDIERLDKKVKGLTNIINEMVNANALRPGSFGFWKNKKRLATEKKLLKTSKLFDVKYVSKELDRIGIKTKKPIEFFLVYGAELSLSPSQHFDSNWYLSMNPDVKASGINPLIHYIKYGKEEGRIISSN